MTLELAVRGAGRLHGDLDPAGPLGGALVAVLRYLLTAPRSSRELDGLVLLRRARGEWWRPEARLDVILHLVSGLRCEEEDRRRLELRFAIALRGLVALVGTGPSPGSLRCEETPLDPIVSPEAAPAR